MNAFSRDLSGIRDRSATAGPIVSGCLREAPFGVPVVPEVRMIALPDSAGGVGGSGSPRSMTLSSVSSGRSSCSESNQPT
jgi:hypothetical protein